MKRILLALSAFIFSAATYAAVSGDPAQGKKIHDASCVGCHDSGVYTRRDHHVQSLADLQRQVGMCGHAAGKKFSVDDQQNLVQYLNDQFYKFK